jgi:hypothetical protein
MVTAVIILALFAACVFCSCTIWSILKPNQIMRKDHDMEEETKKSLIFSILLIIANALGIAYLLNPRRFNEKTAEIKESIRKIFTGK